MLPAAGQSGVDNISHRRVGLMDLRQHFRSLHATPFVIPNPWDAGSARILAALGFPALATTSAGFANALGRPDGRVTRDEAIAHCRAIAAATPLPVSADLENGFGDTPEAVAETIALANGTGLAGCSIEDWGGERGLYEKGLAIDRVRAAIEASRKDASPLVVTARCENFLCGNPDLSDTIARLQAYQEAGADVLYAPALSSAEQVRSVVAAIDRPLNVLLLPGGPTVPELFAAGASRVSTGSALASAAQDALVQAARELLDAGTTEWWTRALRSVGVVNEALRGR
jgi:2-methylisocitrate lyase-like PEP mutase family enzyme